MSTGPVAHQPFPDLDAFQSEADREDVFNPIRGILVGIVLCAPFWAAVYWILRP